MGVIEKLLVPGVSKNSLLINFKYNVEYEDTKEYLDSFLDRKETKEKQDRLKEYYKYHNEVPRWFSSGISDTMGKYHDRKRKH